MWSDRRHFRTNRGLLRILVFLKFLKIFNRRILDSGFKLELIKKKKKNNLMEQKIFRIEIKEIFLNNKLNREFLFYVISTV